MEIKTTPSKLKTTAVSVIFLSMTQQYVGLFVTIATLFPPINFPETFSYKNVGSARIINQESFDLTG